MLQYNMLIHNLKPKINFNGLKYSWVLSKHPYIFQVVIISIIRKFFLDIVNFEKKLLKKIFDLFLQNLKTNSVTQNKIETK